MTILAAVAALIRRSTQPAKPGRGYLSGMRGQKEVSAAANASASVGITFDHEEESQWKTSLLH